MPVESNFELPADDDNAVIEPQDINRAPSLGLDLNSADPLGELGKGPEINDDIDDDFDYDDVQIQANAKPAAKRQ